MLTATKQPEGTTEVLYYDHLQPRQPPIDGPTEIQHCRWRDTTIYTSLHGELIWSARAESLHEYTVMKGLKYIQ